MALLLFANEDVLEWDMITVILCVFLLSYVSGEGKVKFSFTLTYLNPLIFFFSKQSNYFKGSILCLAYLVIMMGFYLSGFSNHMEAKGVNRFEIMDISKSYKTIGRSTTGQAF